MTEYIERESAFHAMCYSCADSCVDLPENNGKCKRGNRYCDEGKALDTIPAADVRPVVHGKWVQTGGKYSRNKTIDRRILTCSVCGNFLHMEGVNAGRGDANFCPNCGALMDKDGDEE